MCRAVGIAVAVVLMTGAPALAATINGTLTYAGLPLTDTFGTMSHSTAAAYSSDLHQWVYGQADPATGAFEIGGLTAGTWLVRVLLGPTDLGPRVIARSLEINASDTIELADEEQRTVELAAVYGYRLTQPYDSLEPWNGYFTCPAGPPTPSVFTLAWEAVPRAARYEVWVTRSDCSFRLSSTQAVVDGLTARIEQGVDEDEQQISVELLAFDIDGRLLTTIPNITYLGGSAEGAYFHASAGGRDLHPSSVFIPQVARVPGVGSSFWTSDVIISNPSASTVVARLLYTPRDADGLDEYLETTVTVPAHGCRVLSDVVGAAFGAGGAGSLEVSPAILEVSSRISTPAPGSGTYGQGFPAVRTDATATFGGPVTTLGAGGVVRGDFRSNLALVEVWGEAAGVRVRVLDRDGVEVGRTSVQLPPFGNTQLNDVVSRVGGPAELIEGQVTVEVVSGAGRVAAVLSLVDNASQDPTTLLLEAR